MLTESLCAVSAAFAIGAGQELPGASLSSNRPLGATLSCVQSIQLANVDSRARTGSARGDSAERKERSPTMKRLLTATFLAATLSGTALAADAKLDARIEDAHAVLHELMATPDKGIPLDIAAKAQCVIVVPGFKKAAFLVGGQYGQGVATCRTESGWSAPAFVQLTGASFGLQAGGQSTDLVLISVTRHSLDDLLKDKVKLGGDIGVAAGPVGRDSQASTTELANAEF